MALGKQTELGSAPGPCLESSFVNNLDGSVNWDTNFEACAKSDK